MEDLHDKSHGQHCNNTAVHCRPMLSVRIYYPKLAILMNEDSMVGRSTACRLELRSLAINIVAEAVHHVRAEATYLELKSMVHTFARSASLHEAIDTWLKLSIFGFQ